MKNLSGKREPKVKTVATKVTPWLREELKRIAAKEGMTLSQVVNMFLMQHTSRYKQNREEVTLKGASPGEIEYVGV